MSRLLAVAMAIAAVAPAQAVSRYSSLQLSCGEITAIVRREGAAIFRYPSPRRTGVTLYDRYVRNSSFCATHHHARHGSHCHRCSSANTPLFFQHFGQFSSFQQGQAAQFVYNFF